MKTLKLSRKKESASLSLFLISKSPDDYAILLPKRAGTWNAKFHFGLHEGMNSRTDDFLRTKISWMHSLPNFLTHGAPLRALRAGELRHKYSVTKAYQETNTGNRQY